MNRKMYFDCSGMIRCDMSVGIARVERNLYDHFQQMEHIKCIPVIYVNGRLVRLRGNSYNELKQQCYFIKIALQLSQIGRLRRLFKVVFPFKRMNVFLDKYWMRYRFFIFPFLLLLSIPSVVATLAYLFFKSSFRISKNDVFLLLGSTWWESSINNLLITLKKNNVTIVSLIYDLIPLQNVHYCSAIHRTRFAANIQILYKTSSLILTISKVVRCDVNSHIDTLRIDNKPIIDYIKLGVDRNIGAGLYNFPIREELFSLFNAEDKVFICVGSIDPRKNHEFLLNAFECIWKEDFSSSVRLLIIGRLLDGESSISDRILVHPQFNQHLLWYDDLNDNELVYCYENATALIFPSKSEGFGLPLIEALRHNCMVFASDIPIFREIGQGYCEFFSLEDTLELRRLIIKAVIGDFVLSDDAASFEWPTWKDVASEFMQKLFRHCEIS